MRPRRRTALHTLTFLGIAAAAGASAGVLVAAGDAGGNPSSSKGITWQTVVSPSTPSGPSSVTLRALPRQAATRTVRTQPTVHVFRSPLGAAALKQAKRNAAATAPAAEGSILPAPRAATASVLAGFDGMANSTTICAPSGCQPSDQGVASNGDEVVQAVNTSIAVYDTSGTLQAGFPKDAQTFFGVPNEPCDTDSGGLPFLSDPRVLYDPVVHRFIIAMLQVEGLPDVAPSCSQTSLYWVAVSQSDDPTGAWNVYAIDTSVLNGFADYTQIGFDGEAIFISGNTFSWDESAYNGAFVLALPKAALEAGQSLSAPSGFGAFVANKQLLDTVQPVASYGDGNGGPPGELLISSFNVAKTTSGVVVFDFSNALGAPSAGVCDGAHQCLSGVVVKTQKYSQPPFADDGNLCTDCLETIDTRISATPVYMHGNVYFTHDTAAKVGKLTNANVLWGIVHPALDQTLPGCAACSRITGQTDLVDQGLITFPGDTDTWFGAIQPDREGNLFIGFDYQSETNLVAGQPVTPSSAFVSRRATAAVGSGFPGDATFLKLSTDPTDDFRWGDYSAIGFDGWESNGVWFATQYSPSSNDWATHVDELGYTAFDQQ